MTLGSQCDKETSHAILDRAYDVGINFIDTADAYPMNSAPEGTGATEQIVGEWLRGRRQRVIVASKAGGRVGPDPWDQGGSRKHLLSAVDATLRRLGTDYLDIYYLHQPDPFTPIDETLEAFDYIVRSGRARYIGCSNLLAYQIARALGRSETRNLVRFSCVQPRYNLLFRQPELEILPLCVEEGLAVVSYNPLAGGLLTGKHDRSARPSTGRFGIVPMYQERYWHDREFDVVEAIKSMAHAAGVAPATLAVAWILANPVVTSPIIGASEPRQLDATLAAADWSLPKDLKTRLDEVTTPFRVSGALR
jgi:aryl-alcohol dehydrogenase (NADP+)